MKNLISKLSVAAFLFAFNTAVAQNAVSNSWNQIHIQSGAAVQKQNGASDENILWWHYIYFPKSAKIYCIPVQIKKEGAIQGSCSDHCTVKYKVITGNQQSKPVSVELSLQDTCNIGGEVHPKTHAPQKKT